MKQILLKSIVVSICIFSISFGAKAQSGVEDLFKGGSADATKLVGAYMNPLFKGLGSGLNSGWSHTAKSKGTLKFELRISATGAFVPSAGQSYDVNKLNLTNISPVVPGSSTGPTAFGNDQQGSLMKINGTTTPFNLPEGLGFHIVPTPQIQATLGLPKHIDVMLRYVPNIKISNDGGKVGMFGLGAKVELMPLFMGDKASNLPFDLAFEMGFAHIKFALPISANGGANQKIDAKFNGFHSDVIISKKLLFFTPFASVGYQSANTKLLALGTYSFDTPSGPQSITDPINIDQKDLGGLRATAGFQIKLAFFKIFGSYTAAEYNTVNAGISFGIGG